MATPGGTNEEDRIAGLLRSMARIYSEALSAPNPRWSSYLPLAREVMAAIDQTSFMARPERREQQIWVLEGLQKLAFKDHDEGGVTDIARWCLQHWLAIVDRSPDNVPALQGLGQYWLLSSQPYLARIHARDGSPSSRSSRCSSVAGWSQDESLEDVEMHEELLTDFEADALLHEPDSVQARAILHPSIEYFRTAVAAASAQGRLNGNLLTLAAEANMSLGNVSYSQFNQTYFRQAILYLRQASQLGGYGLPGHLQRYLDQYGSYVD